MKFSREALKLSDNMKSGFAMPISVLGTPKHSSEYKGVKTPDYLNDFCFEVLEDSGINLINCDSNSAEFGEITELADLHFIGTCDVKPNIEPLSISNDFIEYEKYLRDFCETKKPKYLSYINPLYTNIHKNGVDEKIAKRNFISNAVLVNKFAIEYNIPFWGSVQAGGDFEEGGEVREYYPNAEEFLWMVNIYLAAGAKGIQYYPLLQDFAESLRADGTIDHDRGGILGADGLPTVYWTYIRQANEQLRDAGPMLLQSRCEMLIATGEAAGLTKKLPSVSHENAAFRQLTSVESAEKGVLIGCLDFKNRTGFYIVNNDTYTRREVTLNFDGPQTAVITQLGNKRTESKAESVKLSIAAGGAVLVYLWKHLGD